MDSNTQMWAKETSFNNWELRKHRFTDDMLPIFYQRLRLKPGYKILDMGCGTGMFGRYLAKGIGNGKVTGMDISPTLIEYGKTRLMEENLEEKAELMVGDGYHIPCKGSTFDAVTNYTYLGVLSDPMAGLAEMVRVCKPGGAVSCVMATGVTGTGGYRGEFGFPGSERLYALEKKQEEIFQQSVWPQTYHYSKEWPAKRLPILFTCCGLKNVSLYTFSHSYSNSDPQWPIGYRKFQIEQGSNNTIRYIRERRDNPEFQKYGMSREEFDELLELLERKKEYQLQHLEEDASWEWEAGMSFAVVGDKPKEGM